MFSLQKMSNSLTSFKKLLASKNKIIELEVKPISPHIQAFAGLIVKESKFKKDYAKDLNYLIEHGMSVKDAAKKVGMSASYASKLLRELHHK